MTIPTLEQRLAPRNQGVTRPVMYQRWSDLLFLHWRWDADDLQKCLPPGLWVDRYQNEAWLGIVPFFMKRVRPRFLPALPWLSWFQELNVRTYVHDANGVPGVWFFSLDCDQPLAVHMAQALFGLPYFHSKMSHHEDSTKYLHFRCQRHGQDHFSQFKYRLAPTSRVAEVGSLDFFLAERYVLFTQTRKGLYYGKVAHEPYPLSAADVHQYDEITLSWDGFTTTNRPPDHVIGSHGVDVKIGSLQLTHTQ
jgi:uncharacterized protein